MALSLSANYLYRPVLPDQCLFQVYVILPMPLPLSKGRKTAKLHTRLSNFAFHGPFYQKKLCFLTPDAKRRALSLVAL